MVSWFNPIWVGFKSMAWDQQGLHTHTYESGSQMIFKTFTKAEDVAQFIKYLPSI